MPSESSFSLDGEFDTGAAGMSVMTEHLPDGVAVQSDGQRWKVASKAGTVKYVKSEGEFVATSDENPAGLKLTYVRSTGLFQGSFQLYEEKSETKLKKHRVTVFGAVVNGVGYGTATIKKIGSIPVVIE